ncbi:MAG: hypothetical protein IPN69_02505 [Acidobacteria bacterium]|nr:hypothetical protein [Acidobacteriota bacterium]
MVNKRKILVVAVALVIAAAHLVPVGRLLPAGWSSIYASYFSDIAIPFAFYFLLCAADRTTPILRIWSVRTAIAFVLPAFAETCQYFGIPLLGSTFDPFDYLMYAIGTIAAALIDKFVFSKVFRFWDE